MTRTPLSTSLDGYEVWFLTGSQNLYGEETLRQVAEQSRPVAEGLAGLPVRVVWKPVLTDSDAIRRHALEVNARDDVIGLIAWMHTFSPAKMWIAGPRRAAEAARCTCTRRRTSSCRGARSTSTS